MDVACVCVRLAAFALVSCCGPNPVCVCLCGRVCLGKNPFVFNAVVHADKVF